MAPKRRTAGAGARKEAPKRTKPFRTPQTPFEEATGNDDAAEELVYKVEKIVNVMWEKGSRKYLVKWEGWADKDNTWEPMDNLVGCAAQIREYDKEREKADIEAKAEVLRKRQEAKAEGQAGSRGCCAEDCGC